MLALMLTASDGHNVPLTPDMIAPGHVSIPGTAPLKWDNEHPQLYTLTVKATQDIRMLETITRRMGFQQVAGFAPTRFLSTTWRSSYMVCAAMKFTRC